MYAAGARVFVEAGPGRVLTTLVGKILGSRPHTAVACDVAGEAGIPRFLLALAELAAAGVAVDAEPLWRGRQVRTVSRADVGRQPGWLLNGHLVRTAAGTPLAGGLQPMTAAPKQLEAPSGAAPGQRDVAVLEFLRTTRELVAAQRDVLLGYLGSGGVGDDRRRRPPGPVPGGGGLHRHACGAGGSGADAPDGPDEPGPDPGRRPRHRQPPHRVPERHARPQLGPRGRPQHRLHQAHGDPRRAGRPGRPGGRRRRLDRRVHGRGAGPPQDPQRHCRLDRRPHRRPRLPRRRRPVGLSRADPRFLTGRQPPASRAGPRRRPGRHPRRPGPARRAPVRDR